MRYLLSLNVVVTVMSAAMAVVLAVVLLIYQVHVGDTPRLREDMPLLTMTTLLFAGMSTAGLTTVLAQLRKRTWHWAAQAGFVAIAALTGVYLVQAFS